MTSLCRRAGSTGIQSSHHPDLAKKVLAIDMLACPKCTGRLELIAFIADQGGRCIDSDTPEAPIITGSRTARRVLLLVSIVLALAACKARATESDAVPVTLGKTGPGDAGDHSSMQVGNVLQFAGRAVGTGATLQT